MKLDLITAAAVGVAVLAVATWARNRSASAGGMTIAQKLGISDAEMNAYDYYMKLTQQRRDSGAAMAGNTEYLRYWDTPMAATIYSNGSLGD